MKTPKREKKLLDCSWCGGATSYTDELRANKPWVKHVFCYNKQDDTWETILTCRECGCEFVEGESCCEEEY